MTSIGYKVVLTKPAEKHLDDLPSIVRPRVAEALRGLSDNPRPRKCKKLEDLRGYRVSVGDYRILFRIDDRAKVVTVYKIKHCREAYRS